ncbi:hypothetical protein ElyMa_001603200 [Elysia marginata]|uniref:C-type lectin domain-containing protein n=1 Tax=Elysia marginata TaxID=1093978 RepID=A0AAV4JK16_9GAST|nr:hypothetical protein ElyMa_001603200 [Elysia marginata]
MSIIHGLGVVVTAFAIITRPGKASDSPLSLDVTMSADSPQTATISCSLNPSLTPMKTLDELSIYGSKSNSKKTKNDFQILASVDRWNANPQIFGALARSAVVVSGSYGFETNSSELTISLKSPSWSSSGHRYKCAARGTHHNGDMVTISETAKIDTTTPQYSALAQKVDLLSANVKKGLTNLEDRLSALEDRVNTDALIRNSTFGHFQQAVDNFAQTSEDKFQSLRDALDNARDEFSNLEYTVNKLKMGQGLLTQGIILLNAEKYFELSLVHKDTVYGASKTAETFDILKANRRCRRFKGYLAEINDSDELNFVANFLRNLSSNDLFFVGGKNSQRDGQFRFYHSWKPMPNGLWSPTQSKSDRNDLGCVKIDPQEATLTAVSCDGHHVKYICEIPIPTQ